MRAMYNAGTVIRGKTLGERLKEARKRKGWSRFRLSLETRIQELSIYRYESGKGNPSLPTLMRLAKALDVSIDELLGLKMERGDAEQA